MHTTPLLDGQPRSPTAQTVPRPRLTAQLDRVFDVGVGLVSAEAGAGKTTLLSSWAADLVGPHVAWVTCREKHNDPVVLASEIRAAAAPAVEVPPNTLLGGVFSVVDPDQIAPSGIVLILDDAHLLHSDQVLAVLEGMMARRSAGIAFVVSGRDDPHLPWHRIRLGGVVELRGPDLAFEVSEAWELFARRFGDDRSKDEVAELCRATGGWVTGLCLAGLTVRTAPQPADTRVVSLARHPFLCDFLEAEVLEGLAEDDVRFLEATSVLDLLDPELCDELTGRTDSVDLLERFVRTNLFTVRVSDSPLRFRYHALFSEFLRSRLARSTQTDRAQLLAVASRWFEDRGLTDAAITAALGAEDFERAERLIRAECGPAIRYGLATTVVRWVSGLPAETIDSSPELSLVLARASLARGDLLMAAAALESIRRSYEQHPEPWLRLGILHLSFVVEVLEGNLGGVVDTIEDAIEAFGAESARSELAMLGLDEEALLVYRGLAGLVTGDLDTAIAATDRALTPALLTHPTKATVLGLGVRCLALAWAGEEDQAAQSIRFARAAVLGFDGSIGDGFPFYLASVWISDGPVAERDLLSARLIVEELGLPIYRLAFALTCAHQALRSDSRSVAQRSLAEADALVAGMHDAGFLGQLVGDLRVDLVATQEEGAAGEDLRPREVEVLAEIAAGFSRREAAENLHLSVNTVKTYLRSAYRKLGVGDRGDAVTEATRLGILNGPPAGPDRQHPKGEAAQPWKRPGLDRGLAVTPRPGRHRRGTGRPRA